MARGITQNQVNEAADAILAAGENPTVEKVRAALGTGSPNTITRMLDGWRRQLGDRLRQLSALPEVPDAVGQAMIELWRLANEHAQSVLEGRFTKEHALLDAARAQLAQEREIWERRLQAAEMGSAQAQVARDLAEHACATLDGQLQDSHALRADLVQQRDRLQSHCDHQTEQIQSLRARLDESLASMRTERERQETHIRTAEDRAHEEVDRARQDAKKWQQRYEATERAQRDAIAAMQDRHNSIVDQLRRSEQDTARQLGQIAALEKALSAAYSPAAAKRKNPAAASKSGATSSRRKKARLHDRVSK